MERPRSYLQQVKNFALLLNMSNGFPLFEPITYSTTSYRSNTIAPSVWGARLEKGGEACP